MVKYKTFDEYIMAHANGPAEVLKLEGKPKKTAEPKPEPKKKAKK